MGYLERQKAIKDGKVTPLVATVLNSLVQPVQDETGYPHETKVRAETVHVRNLPGQISGEPIRPNFIEEPYTQYEWDVLQLSGELIHLGFIKSKTIQGLPDALIAIIITKEGAKAIGSELVKTQRR